MNNNNSNFVTEVAKYFMNFLETDFHKTRLPKRNSISKIVKWYKVWLDLEKYKRLKKDFYTIFYNGFKKGSINIKKWTYTSSISDNIFKLIIYPKFNIIYPLVKGTREVETIFRNNFIRVKQKDKFNSENF